MSSCCSNGGCSECVARADKHAREEYAAKLRAEVEARVVVQGGSTRKARRAAAAEERRARRRAC